VATILDRPSARRARRGAASPLHHVDLTLVSATLVLAAFGVLMVYSATQRRLDDNGLDRFFYLKRQGAFVLIGIAVLAAVSAIDYRKYRDFASFIYAGTIALLFLVLTPIGAAHKGQQASFDVGAFQLQPSEFAKVALVIAVASYIGSQRGTLDGRSLMTVLGLAGLPMLLIYLQPDVGTALVFMAILLGMLMVGGARPRHLVLLLGAGLIALVAVVQLGVLQQYQLDRLGAFLDPTNDPQRLTYNLDQSKTAIGSGGLLGKGLYRGTQTNLAYVPEQHTDFIFTAVGEQLGLVGSATALGLFAVVVWRVWRAAVLARDVTGTLMCIGVLAMLVFQLFQNVGMTTGIMPITGIPLPLLSYGGSSALATFAGIGLVLNVHMHRFS
jgi:rod shape determining protein RodA